MTERNNQFSKFSLLKEAIDETQKKLGIYAYSSKQSSDPVDSSIFNDHYLTPLPTQNQNTTSIKNKYDPSAIKVPVCLRNKRIGYHPSCESIELIEILDSQKHEDLLIFENPLFKQDGSESDSDADITDYIASQNKKRSKGENVTGETTFFDDEIGRLRKMHRESISIELFGVDSGYDCDFGHSAVFRRIMTMKEKLMLGLIPEPGWKIKEENIRKARLAKINNKRKTVKRRKSQNAIAKLLMEKGILEINQIKIVCDDDPAAAGGDTATNIFNTDHLVSCLKNESKKVCSESQAQTSHKSPSDSELFILAAQKSFKDTLLEVLKLEFLPNPNFDIKVTKRNNQNEYIKLRDIKLDSDFKSPILCELDDSLNFSVEAQASESISSVEVGVIKQPITPYQMKELFTQSSTIKKKIKKLQYLPPAFTMSMPALQAIQVDKFTTTTHTATTTEISEESQPRLIIEASDFSAQTGKSYTLREIDELNFEDNEISSSPQDCNNNHFVSDFNNRNQQSEFSKPMQAEYNCYTDHCTSGDINYNEFDWSPFLMNLELEFCNEDTLKSSDVHLATESKFNQNPSDIADEQMGCFISNQSAFHSPQQQNNFTSGFQSGPIIFMNEDQHSPVELEESSITEIFDDDDDDDVNDESPEVLYSFVRKCSSSKSKSSTEENGSFITTPQDLTSTIHLVESTQNETSSDLFKCTFVPVKAPPSSTTTDDSTSSQTNVPDSFSEKEYETDQEECDDISTDAEDEDEYTDKLVFGFPLDEKGSEVGISVTLPFPVLRNSLQLDSAQLACSILNKAAALIQSQCPRESEENTQMTDLVLPMKCLVKIEEILSASEKSNSDCTIERKSSKHQIASRVEESRTNHYEVNNMEKGTCEIISDLRRNYSEEENLQLNPIMEHEYKSKKIVPFKLLSRKFLCYLLSCGCCRDRRNFKVTPTLDEVYVEKRIGNCN